MDNIKITEENKKIYTKLYNAKQFDSTVLMVSIILGLIIFGIGLLPFYNYLPPLALSDYNIFLLYLLGYSVCTESFIISIPIIHRYSKIKKFKKAHPEIDIKIKERELKKILENYERLSKIPKDIEIKKEEHLTNFNDEFKEMTNLEKLDFLKNELEFWEKTSKDEAFLESVSETENVVEKKLGRM